MITRFLYILYFAALNYTFLHGQNLSKRSKKLEIRQGDSIIVFTTSPKKVTPNLQLVYYFFDNFQVHKAQGHYSGFLLHDSFEVFMDGTIRSSGKFKNGLKDDRWISWWENGTIKELNTWKKGHHTGPFFKNDESGNHLMSGNYRKGKLEGKVVRGKDKNIIRYYVDNKEVSKEQYRKPFARPISNFFSKLGSGKKKEIRQKKSDQKKEQRDRSKRVQSNSKSK